MIDSPKIGMRVKVLEEVCCCKYNTGKEGIITEIECADSFIVTVEEGKDFWWHCRECVEEKYGGDN